MLTKLTSREKFEKLYRKERKDRSEKGLDFILRKNDNGEYVSKQVESMYDGFLLLNNTMISLQ